MLTSLQRSAIKYMIWTAILFYMSYALSNWFTTKRVDVPEIIFSWEKNIPFIAWTILPYCSLTAFYLTGFWLCENKMMQRVYWQQLMTAQVIAIICFLLFPLQTSWHKPDVNNWLKYWFNLIAIFDQPFNQAPSLHVILTMIVGRFYWFKLSKPYKWVWFIWCHLIIVSVLTTYQHHFIDVITGILVGGTIWYCFPAYIANHVITNE